MTALISKLKFNTLYIHLHFRIMVLDGLNITMHTEVVIHLMNAYVWCWSKICGSLDEILLQWEVMKVKFSINSNMTFA